MKIRATTSGNMSNLKNWVDSINRSDVTKDLSSIGQNGVKSFSRKTPSDSGKTANSWNFEIDKTGRKGVVFSNSNTTSTGIPVAVLIDHGHGTGTGGYVRPRPFIQDVADDLSKQFNLLIEKRLRSNG